MLWTNFYNILGGLFLDTRNCQLDFWTLCASLDSEFFAPQYTISSAFYQQTLRGAIRSFAEE